MKNKIHDPKPLILTEGYISDHAYDNFEGLRQQGPKNWKQGCPFQLGTTGLSGQYQALQLCSMQIGYGKRKGAAMYSVNSLVSGVRGFYLFLFVIHVTIPSFM